MIRAVLDTNTIVSGLFWGGLPGLVLRAAADEKYTLLLSPEIILELTEVLAREKFTRQRTALGKTVDEMIVELQSNAERVIASTILPSTVRDPDDIQILACAVGGKANYIVTGDVDLLVLKRYQEI